MNPTIQKIREICKGELIENAHIGKESWFGCGGDADLLFRPESTEDLAEFLKLYPSTQPVTVLGGMANTIIRDGGVRGATVQCSKKFGHVEDYGEGTIIAEAGALNGTLAAYAMKNGIGGLEFLSGIPGTIGGATRMNAGAYGAEIKDVFLKLYALDRFGVEHELGSEDLIMTYRYTGLPESNMIITRTVLKGTPEPYETIKARIKEIKKKRNETQPIREQTGGSTFANPSKQALKAADLPEDTRAWEVVEKVGGRGLEFGGAKMSEQHCNFMINTGNATASDLENLGEELRTRALHQLGLELKWEIKRVGDKL